MKKIFFHSILNVDESVAEMVSMERGFQMCTNMVKTQYKILTKWSEMIRNANSMHFYGDWEWSNDTEIMLNRY